MYNILCFSLNVNTIHRYINIHEYKTNIYTPLSFVQGTYRILLRTAIFCVNSFQVKQFPLGERERKRTRYIFSCSGYNSPVQALNSPSRPFYCHHKGLKQFCRMFTSRPVAQTSFPSNQPTFERPIQG